MRIALHRTERRIPRSARYDAEHRSRLLGGLLSAVIPGLGQLYAGQMNRARWQFGFFALACSFLVGVYLAVPPSDLQVIFGVVLLLGFLFAVRAFSIADAVTAIDHQSGRGAHRRGRWLVNGSIIGFGLAISASLNLAFIAFARSNDARPGAWQVFTTTYASSAPTVVAGDYIVAWSDYYASHAPRRGDVVIADFGDRRDGGTTPYVRRVVGLPGDQIQLRKGWLYINGAIAPRSEIDPAWASAKDRRAGHAPFRRFIETLPEGRQYEILEWSDDEPFDTTGVYVVPDDRYFVLGDNRDNSRDSRELSFVGYVPRESIRHKPTFIVWSRALERIGQSIQPEL